MVVERFVIPVGEHHTLHVECHGVRDTDAPTFIFLHGGPGHWYSHERHSRWFNLRSVRLVAFDQRGCGKSRPAGSLLENSPDELVDDIGRVADALGLESFALVGGSWGATLAMLYAKKYPTRCRALVLRAPWIWLHQSVEWIWGGWAAQFFPLEWKIFTEILPNNSETVLENYRRLLASSDDNASREAALRWVNWEERLCCYLDKPKYVKGLQEIDDRLLTMARFENHFVLRYTDMVGRELEDIGRALAGTKGYIVQGKFDFLCPVAGAIGVADEWPACELSLVNAGHKADQDPMCKRLRSFIDAVSRDW